MKKLVCITLLLIGCSKPEKQCTSEHILRQLSIIDCHSGILYAIGTFYPQLKDKVSEKQLDEVWAKCGKI